MKLSVFIATSLDGFIARNNGDIDWLVNAPNPEKDDFGYNEFIKSIDVILMGSGTFRTVESFDSWPYPDKKTIVLSSSHSESEKYQLQDITFSQATPSTIVASLEEQSFKNVYVDGGKVIQSFLRANLIDELIITKIPILIGQGRPLFGELKKDLHLHHTKTKSFSNGFVQSTYERAI
ncbi:dihydrofolate reductase [Leptospira ognonensis]|uniref:Dihydrofolate reductase n=1 Tax=Leptospira ognonensis TaxID=2484945 RepID=A0A4R9K4W8_9LEPT|nr:dihydrofolate reductase family protein [Leptospira ognonensis]TGL59307.1 dihydrofolate reductase [Leptospira ognonensis]